MIEGISVRAADPLNIVTPFVSERVIPGRIRVIEGMFSGT